MEHFTAEQIELIRQIAMTAAAEVLRNNKINRHESIQVEQSENFEWVNHRLVAPLEGYSEIELVEDNRTLYERVKARREEWRKDRMNQRNSSGQLLN